MTPRSTSLRHRFRCAGARVAGIAGALVLASALSGCFAPDAGPAKSVSMPLSFPDAIPVDRSDVVESSTEPGGIWRVVLSADAGEEPEIFVEELVESGFVVTGTAGEGADRVFSLANSDYSLRISFADTDGGASTVLLTAAAHQDPR